MTLGNILIFSNDTCILVCDFVSYWLSCVVLEVGLLEACLNGSLCV